MRGGCSRIPEEPALPATQVGAPHTRARGWRAGSRSFGASLSEWKATVWCLVESSKLLFPPPARSEQGCCSVLMRGGERREGEPVADSRFHPRAGAPRLEVLEFPPRGRTCPVTPRAGARKEVWALRVPSAVRRSSELFSLGREDTREGRAQAPRPGCVQGGPPAGGGHP